MLNYLETFFSLAKTLSYTQTAKEMNIAQSAISRQIKLLEEALGLQLFVRTTQSVHLSDSGKELLGKLQPPFDPTTNRKLQPCALARNLRTQLLRPSQPRRSPDYIFGSTT